MGKGILVRTKIVAAWLAGVVVLSMVGVAAASAEPISRPVPRANKVAAHQQRWDPAASVLTSPYEYHEPTNQSKNQQYGSQVALSGDGRTLAVADLWYFGGSEWPWYGSGAVYVYRRVNGEWSLEAKLEPPAARGYDFFGADVALSLDGNLLAVGAQNEGYDAPIQDAGAGSVLVYKRRNGAWTEQAMLRASRPQDAASFGRTVELSGGGDVIAVGAPYESIDSEGVAQSAAGAVYVFTRKAGAWVQQQVVTAPAPQSNDLFGWGVRLSENGKTLAVLAAEQNAQTEDSDTGTWPDRVNTVYVFQKQAGPWNLAVELEGSASEPHFGGSSYESEGQTEGFDLSVDGRTLAIGSPFAVASDGGTGLVRIYRRPGQQWIPTNEVLTPALPDRRQFGLRVTLSANGESLVAFADRDDGAYGHPYVVSFAHQRNGWRQSAIFESPADVPVATGFANSLALSWSGELLALGARTFATENSSWGAVLTYRRQASAAVSPSR